MSQSDRPVPAPSSESRVQEMRASAHLMSLDTGVFCIVNASPKPADGALSGVRISTIDPADRNVSVATFRPDGWVPGGGDAALVRVLRGPAPILITIYQVPGSPEGAPQIRVMRLTEAGPGGEEAAPSAAATPAEALARMALLTEGHDVIAHVERKGDLGRSFGEWMGEPGSQRSIEGFSLTAPADLKPADLTYQAVLGRGWLSPWVEAGQFCGSRGMALPILGLRVKLSEAAARRYDLSIDATFLDGTRIEGRGSDEACEAPSLAPLEAMQISLLPKAQAGAKPRAKQEAAEAKPGKKPAAAAKPKGR
ncbi:hypothetical protein [Acidisoma sp. C75]